MKNFKKIIAPFRRVFGFIATVICVLIVGIYSFGVIFPFYGIDKANSIMDRCGIAMMDWLD